MGPDGVGALDEEDELRMAFIGTTAFFSSLLTSEKLAKSMPNPPTSFQVDGSFLTAGWGAAAVTVGEATAAGCKLRVAESNKAQVG